MKSQRVKRLCKQHGSYTASVRVKVGEMVIYSACPSCEEVKKEIRSDAEKRTKEAINLQWHNALPPGLHLPNRFEGGFEVYEIATTDQQKLVTNLKAFVRDFDRHQASGINLVLQGKAGTGKTHLSASVGSEIRKAGYRVIFSTARFIASLLKRAVERNDMAFWQKVTQECDLLILSEVGTTMPDDEHHRVLFDLIDARYENKRCMICTTNLTTEELDRYLGQQLVRRITNNHLMLLPFKWEPYGGIQI